MSVKKKLVIIGGILAGLALILCISGCLIVNSYLNKINYDTGTASVEPEQSESQSESETAEHQGSETTEATEDSTAPTASEEDVLHILLIGSDNRAVDDDGRSDSMILISINKNTSKIIATSLLRDIYLQIPGESRGNRLNAAYAMGGASLLLSTIQENFRIEVEDYVSVNFYSFIDIIDELGGITITISDAEIEVANNYIREINHLLDLPIDDGILTQAGEQTLSGKQTLGYVRIRYVGNADFGRTDRQRVVLEQVFSKIKQQNIFQLTNLLNDFLPEVTTNLSKSELSSLLLSIPTYANYAVDSYYIPVDGSYSYATVRGMSVLNIDFDQNIAEMQRRIFG